jgi:hypothetical protein
MAIGAQIHLAERIVAAGETLAAPLSTSDVMHGATVRDLDGNDVDLGQLL